MNFLFVLFWQVVEILPGTIGFLVGVRIRRRSLIWAFASSTAGAALNAVLIHLIQAYRFSGVPALNFPQTLSGTIGDILFSVIVGFPCVLYCSAEQWWSNWKTDIALGALIGILYAVAQGSWGWSVDVFHIPLHLITMAVFCAVLFFGVRRLRDVSSWPLALAGGAALAVVLSAIFIVIDYRSF